MTKNERKAKIGRGLFDAAWGLGLGLWNVIAWHHMGVLGWILTILLLVVGGDGINRAFTAYGATPAEDQLKAVAKASSLGIKVDGP